MSLIRFIIIFIIIYLVYKILKAFVYGTGGGKRESAKFGSISSGGEDLVEDPYCHTYIPISNAYRISSGGRTLYFCCRKCSEDFFDQEKRGGNH